MACRSELSGNRVTVGIPRYRAILVFPLLWYLGVILVAKGLCQASMLDARWTWVLLAAAVLIAVSPTRIIRRSNGHLDHLSVRGGKRVLADAYLVHVEMHHAGRFSAIRWQLACRGAPDRSFAMGFLWVGARRSVHAAHSTLGLPLSFETEAWLNRTAGTVAASKRQLITLGGLLAVATVLVIASLDGGAKCDLRLECTPDQVLRLSGGYGTVHGGGTFAIRPGRYGVELWVPHRACWVRRDLTMVEGATDIIRCSELATTAECVAGASPSPAR
jgi:hypothetical protein